MPGKAVGAGRAFTVGVNELLPPGPTAFSVGDGLAGALDCVGAVVSAGFSLVSELHALSAPIPRMATAPAARAKCRVTCDRMINFLLPALETGLPKLYVRTICRLAPSGRGLAALAA